MILPRPPRWLLPLLVSLGFTPPAAAYVPASADAREAACQRGDGAACLELGLASDQGLGVFTDRERADGYFARGCAAGSARACTELGRHREYGIAGPKQPRQAKGLFEKACDLGDGTGCARRAMLVPDGALSSGAEERLEWWRKGCVLHDDESCAAVTATADPLELEALCDAAVAVACFRLGERVFGGVGIAADHVGGMRYFVRACALDSGSRACERATAFVTIAPTRVAVGMRGRMTTRIEKSSASREFTVVENVKWEILAVADGVATSVRLQFDDAWMSRSASGSATSNVPAPWASSTVTLVRRSGQDRFALTGKEGARPDPLASSPAVRYFEDLRATAGAQVIIGDSVSAASAEAIGLDADLDGVKVMGWKAAEGRRWLTLRWEGPAPFQTAEFDVDPSLGLTTGARSVSTADGVVTRVSFNIEVAP